MQTILRHFGSREALFDAVAEFARDQIAAERIAPAGDMATAVRVIFSHYETRGDAVLRFLAQEFWDERVRELTDRGRRMHRDWVRTVFAPQLDVRPTADREALTDLLVIAAELRERGEQVRFLGHEQQRAAIEDAGFRFEREPADVVVIDCLLLGALAAAERARAAGGPRRARGPPRHRNGHHRPGRRSRAAQRAACKSCYRPRTSGEAMTR